MQDPSPPFWATAPPRLHRDRPSSQLKLYLYAILILLGLLLVFLYLPPLFSSAARLVRPVGLRRGWDALNLCLILFAVICAFLGRHQDADPSPRSTDATAAAKNKYSNSPRTVDQLPKWLRDYGDGIRTVEGTPSLSRRNSNSYPDLRLVAEEVIDARPKFYDDIEVISRRRKPNAPHISEVIPPKAAVEQRKLPRHGADEGSKSRRRSNNPATSDKEASAAKGRLKEAEEEAAVAAMRRKLWGDDADTVPRSNMRQRKEDAVGAAENPCVLSKMGSSSSYPDLRDIESLDSDRQQFKDESEIRRRPHHRRRRSYGGEYMGELVTMVDRSYAATPAKTTRAPPPPPPPPPLPTIFKAYKKKTRAAAAKDIATTLATFYGKKSNKKQNKLIGQYPNAGLLESSYTTPNPPPPPPPLPPPPSILSIFSTKKKKTHSPPKPNGPPTAGKQPNNRSHLAGDNQSYLSMAPQSPLVPIAPPPPPPFRMKEMKFKDVGGGFVRVGSGFGDNSDSDAGDVSDGAEAFWPSPSVDTKADTFIARTRAGFMMEKMNSFKEKQVEVGPTRMAFDI